MEIHCLEHSLTRMLADGLVAESASALFSVHKVESYHTGLSGSPGYPFSQRTETLCSPQMWVRCSSLKAETFPCTGSFSPQRKMAMGVDRSRMGRVLSLWRPSLHTESSPGAKKEKKKEKK